MSARGNRTKRERPEMNNPEFVKWRRIWIIVDVLGFSVSCIGIACFRLLSDKGTGVLIMLCGMAILAAGVIIDNRKVTRVSNMYRAQTGYSANDKSKEAVAARRAEKERIAALIEADKVATAELEAKKAAKRK